MKELEYLGNKDLLKRKKWGFLASRQVASNEVLLCYDWATERSKSGDCVVSGFSSKMEKDVLHFLLKGKSPIIMVLARRMYAKLPEEWRNAISEGRMLIISTSQSVRQSRQTALFRNQYVTELCDILFSVESTNNKKDSHDKT
jgi:predicted Rossmann fold nucleotide-binding protein DprA/Smf involved in DNA uptake